MWDSKRDTDIKNRLLDPVGEGEGGMIWENSETCILPYVKKITSPGSMHETAHSKPVHWDNPEGQDGVHDGGHMYMHGWVTSMYGRNHHNIVKQLASNLNTLINLIKNKMHSEKKKKQQILLTVSCSFNYGLLGWIKNRIFWNTEILNTEKVEMTIGEGYTSRSLCVY